MSEFYYRDTLEQNLQLSINHFKLGQQCIFMYDNDPKQVTAHFVARHFVAIISSHDHFVAEHFVAFCSSQSNYSRSALRCLIVVFHLINDFSINNLDKIYEISNGICAIEKKKEIDKSNVYDFN